MASFSIFSVTGVYNSANALESVLVGGTVLGVSGTFIYDVSVGAPASGTTTNNQHLVFQNGNMLIHLLESPDFDFGAIDCANGLFFLSLGNNQTTDSRYVWNLCQPNVPSFGIQGVSSAGYSSNVSYSAKNLNDPLNILVGIGWELRRVDPATLAPLPTLLKQGMVSPAGQFTFNLKQMGLTPGIYEVRAKGYWQTQHQGSLIAYIGPNGTPNPQSVSTLIFSVPSTQPTITSTKRFKIGTTVGKYKFSVFLTNGYANLRTELEVVDAVTNALILSTPIVYASGPSASKTVTIPVPAGTKVKFRSRSVHKPNTSFGPWNTLTVQ